MSRPVINLARDQAMARDYAGGKTLRKLAKAYGLSMQRCHQIVSAQVPMREPYNGFAGRRVTWTPDMDTALLRLWARGQERAAERIGVGINTARQRAAYLGIAAARPGPQRSAAA